MKGVGVQVLSSTAYREMKYHIYIAVTSDGDAYVVSYCDGNFSTVCPCCMLHPHREKIAEDISRLKFSQRIRSVKWASPYLTEPDGSTAYGEVVGGFEEFESRRIVCEPILVEEIPDHILNAIRYR